MSLTAGYDRSSNSLTSIFAGASGFGGSSPAISTTPKTTILQALTGGIKVTGAAPLSTNIVQGDKLGAAAGVQQNMQSVGTVQQQAGADKAAISTAIKQAQNEVAAATRAVGADPASVFRDERIAAGGEGALLLQAAAGGWQGGGSLVTALKASSDIETVVNDLKDSNLDKDKIEAEIKKCLLADNKGPNMDFLGGPQAAPIAVNFDWQGFFDGGHELKTLMSIDADNPSPALVPEYANAQNIELNAETVQDCLIKVEAETVDHGRDNTQQAIASKWTEREKTLMGVSCAGETLPCISGVKPEEKTAGLPSVLEIAEIFRKVAHTLPAPAPLPAAAMTA